MKERPILAIFAALCACNVTSSERPTGGVNATGDELCPAGVVAVLSDYLSTQVTLLDQDGLLLSASFASSGSTEASGVASPLSGDVATPSSRSKSGEIILLDRFGTNVITWLDATSATVRSQLPVSSGFESNPRDYLELSAAKAYVARWGENSDYGQAPYDRGGDVLIVDPSQPAITGNVEMPRDGSDLPPRPVSLTLLGGKALVVLQRLSLDFANQGASEIVAVDTGTDRIAWQLTLVGLQGCGRVMLSPSAETMALGCTGSLDFDGNLIDPAATGIVLLDTRSEPPREIRRISVHAELGFSPQSDIEFAAENLIVGSTQTPFVGEGNNQLFVVDLDDDSVRVLVEANPNDDGTGKGVVYPSLLCTPGCSNACLLADQETSSVRRFDITNNFTEMEAIEVGSDTGLPPIGLGPF